MPHVRCLVGIDAGVLDQDLLRVSMPPRLRFQELRREIRALHPRIDVARSRNLEFFKSRQPAQRPHNLFRDLARRLAQFFGQLHGQGQCILAQGDAGRLRDGDILHI